MMAHLSTVRRIASKAPYARLNVFAGFQPLPHSIFATFHCSRFCCYSIRDRSVVEVATGGLGYRDAPYRRWLNFLYYTGNACGHLQG